MEMLIFTIVILPLIGYVGWHFYMSVYQPAEYAAMKQREHELKLAKFEAERAKQQARKEAAVKLGEGIAAPIAKAVLGAIFKRH